MKMHTDRTGLYLLVIWILFVVYAIEEKVDTINKQLTFVEICKIQP